MGEITNMQKNQDNIDLLYVRKKTIENMREKPRLKIRKPKDLLTLIGSGAKAYKLSKNQKQFQTGARLTIAAIAASLVVGGGIAYHNTQTQEPTNIESSNTNLDELEKNEVLALAEDTLLSIIYSNHPSLKEKADINYEHTDYASSNVIVDCDTITVSHRISPTAEAFKDYSYTKQNLLLDNIFSSKKDCPEIIELLNAMIDVYSSENVSQEDLENLNTIISNLDSSKLELKNGHIVGRTEKDLGDER